MYLLPSPIGYVGYRSVDLESWQLSVNRVSKNSQTGDSVWAVGVGVFGFADPLVFVILDEAYASGDLGWGEEAEWCEEVMVVTATAGETGAEVTASHLDFDASEDAFSCLRASE